MIEIDLEGLRRFAEAWRALSEPAREYVTQMIRASAADRTPARGACLAPHATEPSRLCLLAVGHEDPLHSDLAGPWEYPPQCTAELVPAEANVATLRCELPAGHEGEHSVAGGGTRWANGPKRRDPRCDAHYAPQPHESLDGPVRCELGAGHVIKHHAGTFEWSP